MRRSVCLLLAAAFCVCFAACAAPVKPEASRTVPFTDDAGRTVELPADITRVAPSGAVAKLVMTVLAPEQLVSLNAPYAEAQEDFVPEAVRSLPVTGQLFGGKSNLNLESLLSAAPQIILDLGDLRSDTAETLDDLQTRTGIPVVFLCADLDHMAQTLRTLGSLLSGKRERGAALAAYTEKTLQTAEALAGKIPDSERKTVLFLAGTEGLGVNPAGSSNAQVIERIGAVNAAVMDSFVSKDGGNLIDTEQLFLFDPDVLVYSPQSVFAENPDPAWKNLRAVQEGRCFEIPAEPYSWLSNPPSVNLLPGIWWLAEKVYPEYCEFDLNAVLREYFELFWGNTKHQ